MTEQASPTGKGQKDSPEPQAEQELMEEVHGNAMPPWLEASFPWMVSVTFHLGLFLLFVFGVWLYNQKSAGDDREQITIPMNYTDPTLPQVEHPGINGDPTRDAAQLHQMTTSQGWAQTESKENVADLLSGQSSDTDAMMIALGTGGSVGKGDGGAGRGSGGVLAPYGAPGGGNGGIGVKFYNQTVSAKRIVYILDHSGSMLDNFDFLRQEAIRSVNSMLPVQSFDVVMVSEVAVTIFPSMQRATGDVKAEFAKQLGNFRAQGQNDDLLAPFQEAFEKAFALNPEVIYFETDGHFDPKLMEVVTNLNRNKKVKVICLAFVNHDPSYEDQLKEMAKKNYGQYKFISEKDLGR